MTREEIVNQVKSVLADEFDVEESDIQGGAVIKDALHLDSLSLVDLVAVIQYTFKVNIPVEDLRKIDTFDSLYSYIESHLPQA